MTTKYISWEESEAIIALPKCGDYVMFGNDSDETYLVAQTHWEQGEVKTQLICLRAGNRFSEGLSLIDAIGRLELGHGKMKIAKSVDISLKF